MCCVCGGGINRKYLCIHVRFKKNELRIITPIRILPVPSYSFFSYPLTNSRNRKKFVGSADKLHACHNDYCLSILNANKHLDHYRESLTPFSLDTLQQRMQLQIGQWLVVCDAFGCFKFDDPFPLLKIIVPFGGFRFENPFPLLHYHLDVLDLMILYQFGMSWMF